MGGRGSTFRTKETEPETVRKPKKGRGPQQQLEPGEGKYKRAWKQNKKNLQDKWGSYQEYYQAMKGAEGVQTVFKRTAVAKKQKFKASGWKVQPDGNYKMTQRDVTLIKDVSRFGSRFTKTKGTLSFKSKYSNDASAKGSFMRMMKSAPKADAVKLENAVKLNGYKTVMDTYDVLGSMGLGNPTMLRKFFKRKGKGY